VAPGKRTGHHGRSRFHGLRFSTLAKPAPVLMNQTTNAGGAFLNAQLGQAQKRLLHIAMCNASVGLKTFDAAVIRQFEAEWRASAEAKDPSSIAIVDDHPMGKQDILLFLNQAGAAALKEQGNRCRHPFPSAELRYERRSLSVTPAWSTWSDNKDWRFSLDF